MDMHIKQFISNNQDLFMDVQDGYKQTNTSYDKYGKYSILYYEKMLTEMIDYLDGYMKYKNDDEDTYRGKVAASTEAFYNKMFSDTTNYRQTISLGEFQNINRTFLQLTKRLQDKMQDLDDLIDTEAKAMLIITDRQYRKIGKVFHDDMQIYLWITQGKAVTSSVTSAYSDKSTPVMHKSI